MGPPQSINHAIYLACFTTLQLVGKDRTVNSSKNMTDYFSLPLSRVQMMKGTNKMDAKNLSVVFAPTLMRSPDNTGDLSAVQKLPHQRKAVELLITNCHKLFQY